VGNFASMALISDAVGTACPAIAYFNATTNAVRYRRAADTTGAAWGSAVTALNANATAITLRQVLGHAFVTISHASNIVSFNMSYDDVGASWGTTSTIEADSAGSLMSASVTTSGLPVLAYYDTAKELHFAHPKLD